MEEEIFNFVGLTRTREIPFPIYIYIYTLVSKSERHNEPQQYKHEPKGPRPQNQK